MDGVVGQPGWYGGGGVSVGLVWTGRWGVGEGGTAVGRWDPYAAPGMLLDG